MESSNEVAIETGTELLTRISAQLTCLPTACHSVDRLLDGGIWSNEITEISGPSACAKTQLCYAVLCSAVQARAQRPERVHQLLYVDSSASFRPNRIRDMLLSRKRTLSQQELDQMLSWILYVKVTDAEELQALLKRLITQCSSGQPYSLLIVDSIGGALQDTVLMADAAKGRRLQTAVALQLRRLCVQHNCAVLTVNHVTQWRQQQQPALGQNWLPVPDTRMLLWRSANTHSQQAPVFCARLIHSTRTALDGSSAEYRVGSGGLIDATGRDWANEWAVDQQRSQAQFTQAVSQQQHTQHMLFEWTQTQQQPQPEALPASPEFK